MTFALVSGDSANICLTGSGSRNPLAFSVGTRDRGARLSFYPRTAPPPPLLRRRVSKIPLHSKSRNSRSLALRLRIDPSHPAETWELPGTAFSSCIMGADDPTDAALAAGDPIAAESQHPAADQAGADSLGADSLGADHPAADHPTMDHPAADQDQIKPDDEQTSGDPYLATVDRLSLVSWGDGSGPSLPSVADDDSSMVSAWPGRRAPSFLAY